MLDVGRIHHRPLSIWSRCVDVLLEAFRYSKRCRSTRQRIPSAASTSIVVPLSCVHAAIPRALGRRSTHRPIRSGNDDAKRKRACWERRRCVLCCDGALTATHGTPSIDLTAPWTGLRSFFLLAFKARARDLFLFRACHTCARSFARVTPSERTYSYHSKSPPEGTPY